MGRASLRKLWAAKLAGVPDGGTLPRASSRPTGAGSSGVGATAATGGGIMRTPFRGLVLGIDPSLRGTGLALIDFAPGRAPLLLRCRTVRVPPREPFPVALAEIHRAVESFLADFDARHVALEQTIYVQNFQTAQILGAARGAAVAAAALREKPIFEYPPLRVKQAVVGLGRASKEQMVRTVMSLLGHGRTLAADEADAAGVALCHAFTWRGDDRAAG
ncbi:MAG: crossover junction endodeoxyribonuclease RuvC [Verrucomicrobia bacterium]|nr:crossover junction endodeoxyribonuclease RuvC [Verrucomicrobiota bacterium]